MLSCRRSHSLNTSANRLADMHNASATRVQTSQTRNSSVGYFQCGRTSHHTFEPSGMQPVVISVWRKCWYADHDAMYGGSPVRGNARNTAERYDFSPVSCPIQN